MAVAVGLIDHRDPRPTPTQILFLLHDLVLCRSPARAGRKRGIGLEALS
jgi:hypothetical protein